MWLYNDSFGKGIKEDIFSIVSDEPYDRNEYAGVLDMHWGFKTWDHAVSFSYKLKKFAENPNVIFYESKQYEIF